MRPPAIPGPVSGPKPAFNSLHGGTGAATAVPVTGPLIDQFGRLIHKLRISVTDHCNLRCVYCMPEDVQFLPNSEILTIDEIERVVRIVASMGVSKIRLTGGEPLLRPQLPELVRRLKAVRGVVSVTMTSNGLLLADLAGELKKAGLDGINISLDTLDPEQFRQIARRGDLQRVLAGIAAADRADLAPIKLNCLVLRGINDTAIIPLLRWAHEKPYQIRFIEFMPLDGENLWERELVFNRAEILARARNLGPFAPLNNDAAEPARLYRYEGGKGVFGVIASVSEPFCHACDRIRLTAEGRIRNCLFALEEHDLRDLLRNGAADPTIERAIRAGVWGKWAGHSINRPEFVKPTRTMHAIGG